ncbi:hypothetical protein HQQ81_09565 [Microbacteriaceae bacterium VKM Ac-2854]|nr:hypothetical protein [Microbacteriaceae bacterium VKM Ac-2854]
MILIETHPGRWAVRDTPNAPARAIITESANADRPVFRAAEWHLVASDRYLIGEYPTLESAFSAVIAFVARSHGMRSSA